MLAPLSFGAPFEIRDDFEQFLPEDTNLIKSPLGIFLNSKTQYNIGHYLTKIRPSKVIQ